MFGSPFPRSFFLRFNDAHIEKGTTPTSQAHIFALAHTKPIVYQ